jgi:hypothetical protein
MSQAFLKGLRVLLGTVRGHLHLVGLSSSQALDQEDLADLGQAALDLGGRPLEFSLQVQELKPTPIEWLP